MQYSKQNIITKNGRGPSGLITILDKNFKNILDSLLIAKRIMENIHVVIIFWIIKVFLNGRCPVTPLVMSTQHRPCTYITKGIIKKYLAVLKILTKYVFADPNIIYT